VGWDKDLYLMKVSMQFENLKENSGLAVNLAYYSDKRFTEDWDANGDTSA